jgi:serpin B
MYETAEFKYGEFEGGQLLELPYAGGNVSLDVLLPREFDGLKRMESQLTPQTLAGWLAQGRQQRVEVFLPRFELTAQFRLDQTLTAMGMGDAFSRGADFSGMDGEGDLFISAVVHKAFVDVNERGTEAAAATAVMIARAMVMRAAGPTFRADHPFLFLIRDLRSGSILFLGRVVDPTRPG